MKLAIVVLACLVSLNVNAASSVTVLDAQLQAECFAEMIKAGAKPSQAHKFCRSIYGK